MGRKWQQQNIHNSDVYRNASSVVIREFVNFFGSWLRLAERN